jgi:hypothetical protein
MVCAPQKAPDRSPKELFAPARAGIGGEGADGLQRAPTAELSRKTSGERTRVCTIRFAACRCAAFGTGCTPCSIHFMHASRPPLPRALYHCNYCHTDISNEVRIKCADCQDFDLCLDCFAVGVEVTPHRNTHRWAWARGNYQWEDCRCCAEPCLVGPREPGRSSAAQPRQRRSSCPLASQLTRELCQPEFPRRWRSRAPFAAVRHPITAAVLSASQPAAA